MKRVLPLVTIIIITFLCIAGCTGQHREKVSEPPLPEASGEPDLKEPDVKIKRYEKALFNVDKQNLKQELLKLQKEYRFFLAGDLDDTLNLMQLEEYLADPYITDLYKVVEQRFPTLEWLEQDFSKVFFNYKRHFPNKKIPEVYSYVSGLDYRYPVKYVDSVLIIALDMYLGKDASQYESFPLFKRYWMNPASIVPDCIKEMALMGFYTDISEKNLLERMVYNGKLLYFNQVMMPWAHDSIIIDYTPKQLEWCKDNEANVWSFFIEKELLFNTQNNVIKKYLADGPFTSVFSNESPPRIAAWFGWQIVKAYMENNSGITLEQLMKYQDAQSILSKSGYKPTR